MWDYYAYKTIEVNQYVIYDDNDIVQRALVFKPFNKFLLNVWWFLSSYFFFQ